MITSSRFSVLVVALFAATWGACTPGYMKASDLERLNQGPNDCAKSCYEIGMRMTALVLVSNQLPGCVCQPNLPPPAPSASSTPAPTSDSDNGAAAAVTAEVVVAAAAAAAQQRHQQQAQQQAHSTSK